MAERVATIVGRRKNGEEFPAEAAISKLQIDGSTILTVALRDITARKRIEKEQRFLSEAGSILASSLDYEQTLANVGAARRSRSGGLVHRRDHRRRRTTQTVEGRQRGPDTIPRLHADRTDADRPGASLARPVIESRRPIIIERLSPRDLESFAQSPEHLRLLHAIDPKSVMGLPLLIRGQLLGVVIFISSTPYAVYGATTFSSPRRSRNAPRLPSKTDASTVRPCRRRSSGTRCSAS